MKKTIIAAGIALMSALSLTACGKVTVSEVENGKITSSSEMQIDDIEEYTRLCRMQTAAQTQTQIQAHTCR